VSCAQRVIFYVGTIRTDSSGSFATHKTEDAALKGRRYTIAAANRAIVGEAKKKGNHIDCPNRHGIAGESSRRRV
jgi:hypothetical protein